MKICLVATPFSAPNLPPLGIACLKSYVERHLPEAQVRLFDLNMEFFNRVLREGTNISCMTCPAADPHCLPPEHVVSPENARRLERSLRKLPSTRREISRYIEDILLFDQYFGRVRRCYETGLRRYLADGELPEVCASALRRDLEAVLAERPDAVGFSLLSLAENLPYTLALAKLLKSRTDIPVLLGGSGLAGVDADEVLRACPYIDFVFQRESENALVRFLEAMGTGRYDRVPNIVYRKGRRTVANARDPVRDLDTVPFPDFSDIDLNGYLAPEKVLPVAASRGCYWGRCTFCYRRQGCYEPGFRCRSAANVLDELEHQQARHGVDHFAFVDDVVSPRRLRELSAGIMRRRMKLFYEIEGLRIEPDLTGATLRRAHKSGLRMVFFGAESIHQRLLDVIDKGIRATDVRRSIRDCYRIGVFPVISYIVGLPFQTASELRRDFAFVRQHSRFHNIGPHPLRLYRDSPLFEDPGRHGITVGQRETVLTLGKTSIHSNRYLHGSPEGISPDAAQAELVRRFSLPDIGKLGSVERIGFVYDFVLSAAGRRLRAFPVRAGDTVLRGTQDVLRRLLRVKRPKAYQRYLLAACCLTLGRYRESSAHLKRVRAGEMSGGLRRRLCMMKELCRQRTSSQTQEAG